MLLDILDQRNNWHRPLTNTARARGWDVKRIERGFESRIGSIGFFRPSPHPKLLVQAPYEYATMESRCKRVIQDAKQVQLYDSKLKQADALHEWLPATLVVSDFETAERVVRDWPEWPIVSKASCGASSKNVRILSHRVAAMEHLQQIFYGEGILVDHCSGGHGAKGSKSRQTGYAILQQFVPSDCTWRVNIVGRYAAVFQRFNYPDKPVAQTGNTKAITRREDMPQALLGFAREIAERIGTKWCAFDIVSDDRKLFLLETSLAWPWPGVGEQAAFFGPEDGRYTWPQMWDLMLDEVEAGVWAGR